MLYLMAIHVNEAKATDGKTKTKATTYKANASVKRGCKKGFLGFLGFYKKPKTSKVQMLGF